MDAVWLISTIFQKYWTSLEYHFFSSIFWFRQLELSRNNFEPDELEKIPETYPHLTTLILQENQIQNFKQLHPLTSLKNLFQLDLSRTPLSKELNYRQKVFELLPQIDVWDFLYPRFKSVLRSWMVWIKMDVPSNSQMMN